MGGDNSPDTGVREYNQQVNVTSYSVAHIELLGLKMQKNTRPWDRLRLDSEDLILSFNCEDLLTFLGSLL